MRLVATFHLTLLVVSLQRVRLNDQKRIVVERRYLCCTPSELVYVAMSVPLSHHRRRLATINHTKPVEYHDNRPVSFIGTSTHIDNGKITVDNFVAFECFRHCPYRKQSLPVCTETEIGKCILSFVSISIYLTDILRLLAEPLELLDTVFVEHHRTRMNESLHIIRRELGSHYSKVVLTSTLLYVPVDSLQCSPFLP